MKNRIKKYHKSVQKGFVFFIVLANSFNSLAQTPWTQKLNFAGTARNGAVAFSIGTKGYLCSGHDGTAPKKDLWEWDQTNNVWTQKADLPGPTRFEAIGFSIGAKGYVGTGANVSTALSDFWEWDQTNNIWTQKASLALNRRGAVGFSIANKGYISTGTDITVSNFYSDIWEYDPATDYWTRRAEFPGVKRAFATGFSIGAMGYLGMGSSGNSQMKDFWEFNPSANSWMAKQQYSGIGAVYAVGVAMANKGFVITDENGKNLLWEFKPINNSWRKRSDFIGSIRHGAIGFSIDSMLYFGTGWLGGMNTQKNDFWEYSYSKQCFVEALFQPSNDTVEIGSVVSLSNTSLNSNSYIWKIDGKQISTSLNTTYTCNNPGYINVELIATNGYCSDTLAKTIFVNPWLKKSNIGGLGRGKSVGFSIGTKGYLGTGNYKGIDAYYSDFWEYNTVNDTWTQKADFGGGKRCSAVGLSISNKGYVGLGKDSLGYRRHDFWEYNPLTNVWTQKADYLDGEPESCVGFVIGTKGYVGLGYGNSNGSVYAGNVYAYDPSLDSWNKIANFPGTPRTLSVSFSIGNKGYIGTGENGGYGSKDFWEYNSGLDVWTRKADFAGLARMGAIGFSNDTLGFIGLGTKDYTGNPCYNDIWMYTPYNDSWKRKGGFAAEARAKSACFLIGNHAYIGTGIAGNDPNGKYFNDFYEYKIEPNCGATSNFKANLYFAAVGDTISFMSTSLGASSYKWLKDGVVFSTLQNPNYIFQTAGFYTISLVASNGTCNDTLQKYFTIDSLNTWYKKANFLDVNAVYFGFSINNKGYLGTEKTFWEYDPANDYWTEKANVTGKMTPFYYNTKGFSIGNTGYLISEQLWQYSPASNMWVRKADFPVSGATTAKIVTFPIQEKVYVYKSNSGFWEYNPTNDSWIQKTAITGISEGHIGFSINNKGYLGIGASGNSLFGKLWEYNPLTDTWLQKNDIPTQMSPTFGFTFGDKAFVGNAQATTNPYGTINYSILHCYDPIEDRFVPIPESISARVSPGGVGFTIGNKIYIGGGTNKSTSKPSLDFRSFTPLKVISNFDLNITNPSVGDQINLINKSYSYSLTGSPNSVPFSYVWTIDGIQISTSKNTVFNPSAVGTYTIALTTSQGANSDTKNCIVVVNICQYWKRRADLIGSIENTVALSLNSKIYLTTGKSQGFANGSFNRLWEYDPELNSWSQKADFQGERRSSAFGFSIGNKGYVGTGEGGTYLKDLWEYDAITNNWTRKADLPGTNLAIGNGSRGEAVGFSIGTKGYISTGYIGRPNESPSDLWEYDPGLDKWTLKSNFPGPPRYGAVGFSIGTKGYVGTGYDLDSNTYLKDFWEYDQATDKWVQKADFAGGVRNLAVGFAMGNKGYIGTGQFQNNNNSIIYSNVASDMWEWSPSTNTWTQMDNFNGKRINAFGISDGSKAYVGGGEGTGPGFTNNYPFDFYEFSPCSDLSITIDTTTCYSSCKGKATASLTGGTPPYSYLWSNSQTTQTVTNLCAKYYSVTVTDANKLKSIRTINLATRKLNTSVVQNGAILTAQLSGKAYQWLSCKNNMLPIPGETNQSYTALTNGDYAVELNSNGCIDTSVCTVVTLTCFAHYTVIKYDTLQNIFTLVVDSLTTAIANSYHWNFGDGNTSTLATPSHTYTVDTVYNVCLKIKTVSNDSCSYCHIIGKDYLGNIYRTSGFTINVINPNLQTAVSPILSNENGFIIFPNPTSGETEIMFNRSVNNISIKVFNVTGQKILEKTSVSGNRFNIDISHQAAGVYFIEVLSGEGIWRGKLIKE